MPFRGTILNTITVLIGSTVGLLAGSALPDDVQGVAMAAIGLINLGFGVKLFIATKNVLIPTILVIGGGLIGEEEFAVFGLCDALSNDFENGNSLTLHVVGDGGETKSCEAIARLDT